MGFIKKLAKIRKSFKKKKIDLVMPNCHCAHPKQKKFTMKVKGVEGVLENFTMCPSCAKEYFEKHSTSCASCKDPIVPSEAVGRAPIGAEHPFTHLTFECCPSGGLYCGVWGESRLVTLHELKPDKYPEETCSAIGHALKSGEPVIESI